MVACHRHVGCHSKAALLRKMAGKTKGARTGALIAIAFMQRRMPLSRPDSGSGNTAASVAADLS